MSSTVRSIWLGALVVGFAATANAQEYRVMLASPQSSMITVAEFRPCVASDRSRCGAWIDHAVDASLDHSLGQPPGVLDRGRSPNGKWDLSLAAVAVRVTSLMMPDSGRHADVKVASRTPRAIAMSSDSRYAFAVFDGLDGQTPEVCMIDLNKHNVIATLDTKNAVSGIGMVP